MAFWEFPGDVVLALGRLAGPVVRRRIRDEGGGGFHLSGACHALAFSRLRCGDRTASWYHLGSRSGEETCVHPYRSMLQHRGYQLCVIGGSVISPERRSFGVGYIPYQAATVFLAVRPASC